MDNNLNNVPNNGMPNNGTPNNNVYVQPVAYAAPVIPEEYKPISMWGYFGYEILFTIPCVGLILLLVFSFGGTKNLNLRNFARSYFCFLIIVMVLLLLLAVTGALAFLQF